MTDTAPTAPTANRAAWPELLKLALSQHQLFTAAQAAAQGVSRGAVQHYVDVLGGRRVRIGVIAVAGSPATPLQRIKADQLTVSARPTPWQRNTRVAVVTGWSALFVWGLRARDPATTTLLATRSTGGRCEQDRLDVRLTVRLDETDCREVHGIGVTSVPRTLTFLAGPGRVPVSALRPFFLDARQRGHTTDDQLHECLARQPRAPRRRELAALVSTTSGSDSEFEQLVRERLARDGLRPDPEQAEVPVLSGHVLEVDITFAWALVGIECDSAGYHSDRRALDLDARRHNGLQLTPWLVLRLTWDRYHADWPGFLGELRSALAQARRRQDG